MKRKKWLWLAVAIACCVACLWPVLVNPARRPYDDLATEARTIAPTGSTIAEVQAAIKRHYGIDAQPTHRDYEGKYYYIRVEVGHVYELRNFPFVTIKSIHWTFDENHLLATAYAVGCVDGP